MNVMRADAVCQDIDIFKLNTFILSNGIVAGRWWAILLATVFKRK